MRVPRWLLCNKALTKSWKEHIVFPNKLFTINVLFCSNFKWKHLE